MKRLSLLALCACVMLASCGGANNSNSADNNTSNSGNGLVAGSSGDMQAYLAAPVHSIQQALPTIMVIPSDQTLSRGGYLTYTTLNGEQFEVRDYNKFLVNESNSKQIISSIQDAFIQIDFPLSDFEQTLKQIKNDSARDMADGIAKDAKTELLSVAHPDIILEIDYNSNGSSYSHDYSSANNVSYTLRAIDAYTNKVVATISAEQLKGASISSCITKSIGQKMKGFSGNIQKYFSNILTMGREVTVRINVAEASNINLNDESIEGDTYADWIIDYIKTHTIKGAYTMQRNSEKELYFVNVRIALIQPDGTQYGVYDWTRDLSKNLRKNLGVKCTNRSQGLGEVVLSIEEL